MMKVNGGICYFYDELIMTQILHKTMVFNTDQKNTLFSLLQKREQKYHQTEYEWCIHESSFGEFLYHIDCINECIVSDYNY